MHTVNNLPDALVLGYILKYEIHTYIFFNLSCEIRWYWGFRRNSCLQPAYLVQVPGDERAKLVQELLELIEGKVMAIVMKHDASRVVQTALQFGNREVFYGDVRK